MLRCTVISSDISHSLHSVLLKSGHRLNSIYYRTAQYNKSVVPSSIGIVNGSQ